MIDRKNARDIFPPAGPELAAKSWQTEAPLRMLMNNLHPDAAENPHELVVYGGIGRECVRRVRAVGRPRGYLQDQCNDEGIASRQRPFAQVAGHGDLRRWHR